MDKHYRIAGLTVSMDTYGRMAAQALPYETEQDAKVDITIKPDVAEMKRRFPDLVDEGCEYMACEKSFYHQLIWFEGLRIHSSAVVIDGMAYLFSAVSGTGKSTHTSLWRRVFGDERVRMLNDDKPAVRQEDGTWYAYGTPWCGKSGQNANLRVPLGGIALLERAEQNEIQPYTGTDAIFALFRQATRPQDMKSREKVLDLLDKLMTQVPIWKLKCNMEPEAAIVAYEAMSGKKWEETK